MSVERAEGVFTVGAIMTPQMVLSITVRRADELRVSYRRKQMTDFAFPANIASINNRGEVKSASGRALVQSCRTVSLGRCPTYRFAPALFRKRAQVWQKYESGEMYLSLSNEQKIKRIVSLVLP